jgi:hypothetical protein
MKRISLVAALVGAVVFAFAGIAMAGNGYGSQPGNSIALSMTTCAGAGAFGAFGNGQVTHDFGKDNVTNSNGAAPGVDGTQVGANNSALCGNG